MEVFVFLVGLTMVMFVLADQMNTLVSTHTSKHRFWLTARLSVGTWATLRMLANRFPEGTFRESLLRFYPPVLVLVLLVVWVSQQIVGFALIFWALGGIDGADSLADLLYYSGVVFFSIGFGEILPADAVPRLGAVVEAFSGLSTIALVIAYLPSLYSAYSERERKLMTLDAGTEERIRATDLVLAWSPDADTTELLANFSDWEDWVAGVLETHTTFPMLRLFRSHHHGQSWITALGLVCDAALQAEIIVGAKSRSPYWMLRRSIRLLQELTQGADLSQYRAEWDTRYEREGFFEDIYQRLEAHGFELMPLEEARAHTLRLRRCYDAQLSCVTDRLAVRRGFWAHEIGQPLAPSSSLHLDS